MRNKYFTLVGSRHISEKEYLTLFGLAKYFAQHGYILRSGKADGADTAGELGFREGTYLKPEIYIPWKNFKGGSVLLGDEIVLPMPKETLEYVKKIHPAFDRLSQGALKLHQRNIHQVLGLDLHTPSEILIACADFKFDQYNIERVKGGTATAWNLAKEFNIPCINIRNRSKEEILTEFRKVYGGDVGK